jgi:hypothetical protein
LGVVATVYQIEMPRLPSLPLVMHWGNASTLSVEWPGRFFAIAESRSVRPDAVTSTTDGGLFMSATIDPELGKLSDDRSASVAQLAAS